MKKLAKVLVLALAMVMMVGAGTTAEAKGTVSKVQITKVGKTNVKKKSKLTVTRDDENKKIALTVNVKTKNGASKALKFKSSNKKVVAVDSKGVLTIKKAGKATITVTSKANKKKFDKITITVKQNVTSIKATFTGKTKPIASYNDVYTLIKGKKYTLKASVAPKTATSKKVTFKSSKKAVASVNAKGVITAKKAGTAKITITAKDGSKEKKVITVYVTKKPTKKTKITSLKAELVADNDILLAGEKATVKVTVNKKAALQKYSFKSSNTKVAKVDATSGKVTAVAPGTATITVKAMDGSKKSAKVTVKVGKEYTEIAPKAGVTATVTVSFDGNAKAVAADVEKLLKAAGMKDGDSKMVTVNGNTDKVAIKNGKVVVGESEMALADYLAKKVAKDDKVTITYGANAAKAVAAIELAKFAAVGEYAYDITVDGYKATKLVVTTKGIELTVDGKTYAADVVAGVITIDGNVTADKAIEYVKNYADIKVVRK